MDSRPKALDLFCGLGGWAQGFLAEGYRVIGFDIERQPYPGQLVIQDVLTLHGSQLRYANAIVASPPCQEPSYRAMPWKRAKTLNEAGPPHKFIELFNACFRLQREACEAAGRYIPMVVENVCGAQKWVGRARWHYGSYYLWGDVPALMPFSGRKQKWNPDGTTHGVGSWFAIADSINRGASQFKGFGGPWFAQNHNTNSGSKGNPVDGTGIKQHGSGREWFDNGICQRGSRTNARKIASAQIAMIPFPLARWVAQCFRPICEPRAERRALEALR